MQQILLLAWQWGVILSSDSKRDRGDVSTLYIAPRLIERLKEPLAMKQCSKNFDSQSGRQLKTLQELFAEKIKDSNQYEIPQVVSIIYGGRGDFAVIWFVFIKKTN